MSCQPACFTTDPPQVRYRNVIITSNMHRATHIYYRTQSIFKFPVLSLIYMFNCKFSVSIAMDLYCFILLLQVSKGENIIPIIVRIKISTVRLKFPAFSLCFGEVSKFPFPSEPSMSSPYFQGADFLRCNCNGTMHNVEYNTERGIIQ